MADRRELTLRGYEALATRDRALMKELCEPDMELESRFSTVSGSIYRGHEGIDRWFDDLAEAWEMIEAHLQELAEEDENTTLVLVRLKAKGRGSGVDLDEPVAQRHSWRGDKLTRIVYVDRAEAEATVKGLRSAS